MGFIGTLIIGAVAGWLASIVMKTNASQGLLMDIILGIVGAFVGGFVASLMGLPGFGGFDLYSLLVATVGAIIVIAVGRMFTRGGATPTV